MALKRSESEAVVPISSGNATKARTITATKPLIKRAPEQDSKQWTSKEDLENILVAVKCNSYSAKHAGKYGPTERVIVNITQIENGEHHADVIFHGGLAKQIGEHLKPGEIGLGRIVSGAVKSGTGRWWGIDWSHDDDEYASAEAVIEAAEIAF
jgi:hypothetical protein